ncbi:MAG: Hsp70 family protein [Myxococcales bacterium]|nr:Hsp70 family protein [Myxococcales bacterium]
MSAARFVVGIDLGTTNSAVAYVDTTAGEHPPIQSLAVPQLVAPGTIEPRPTLPSFLYLPGPELPDGAVGELARSRGADAPARVVASAKSWLAHAGVDRAGAILPWGAPDDGAKLSPIEASARYLAHLASAWHAAHPDAPLAEQDVYLTVPASFDAAARELTVAAARQAGLARITLLEEPQAAFYAWLAAVGDAWRTRLKPGDVVLVCDVGGGTTDFSLIAVADAGGDLELERIAVGDHILLGGDNMDLALAHALAQGLAEKGTRLDAWQTRALVHACRHAKERLLSESKLAKAPVAILGRGSKVIGGSIKLELTRELVERTLVDGFFPVADKDARPIRARRSGFAELGLPYAADAAVTRHLAEFVARHGRAPTALLPNGGVMKGALLRTRLLEITRGLGDGTLVELTGTDLDLAVAQGAAYYGLVRRGHGVRIRGGAARSYYVGVETGMPAVPGMAPPIKALCVVPFGMEEGTSAPVPGPELALVVGESAEFRFLGSTTRRGDTLGTVVDDWEGDLFDLGPLEATLPADGDTPPGTTVPVRLEAHLTAVGTLELFCVARGGAKRWRLEFEARTGEEKKR